MDTIYFFAINEDLYTIFGKIEEEFDIKYCAERVDVSIEDTEVPRIEYNSIKEFVGKGTIRILISEKSEQINTYYRKTDREAYYKTEYDKNRNCVVFNGGKVSPTMISDYQLHIYIPYGSIYATKLFKRIVQEVKRNCVKINSIIPFYVGNEMYKYKDDYVFLGQRFAYPLKITNEGGAIRWWHNENVRLFMGKPLEEQLLFLNEVFLNRIINDYDEELKNNSVNYQMYNGVMFNMANYKGIDLIDKIMPLFNDDSKALSPLTGGKTAMEELRDIAINLALSYKEDGIRVLLDSLKNIPNKGYNCGSKSIIQILLKKKYNTTFQMSLANSSIQTKNLVKAILDDITEKRLMGIKDEIISTLIM